MKKIILFTFGLLLSCTVLAQNVDVIIFEEWKNGAWVNYNKMSYTYDGNSYLTHLLSQNWEVASISWKNNYQMLYTNNPNGTMQQSIYQNWDNASNSWKNSSRITYTYNTNNNWLNITGETWSNGAWVNSYKTNYTYDGNGYLTNIISQNWEVASISWKNNYQMLYTNNPNGIMQQSIYQDWDNGSNSWKNSSRNVYTYNANNQRLTNTCENWTNGAWVNYYKMSYTYDGNGYLTHLLNQNWDIASISWKNNYQMLYTNNPNGTIQQSIYQNWDNASNSWKNSSRLTYKYVNNVILSSSYPLTGGTTSGGGSYAYNTSITLNATANSGYTFSNWTENGTVVSTSASYTFTVSSNRNLVANFSQNAPSNYTITTSSIPVAGGSTAGGGSYAAGSSITLNATANSGYTFSNWTENGTVVSMSASYTFTVSSNRNLVANFSQNAPSNYTIATSSIPVAGGSTAGGGSYTAGSSITLTATANSGYTFSNWTENGTVVSTSTSYTFNVTKNRILVANFSSKSAISDKNMVDSKISVYPIPAKDFIQFSESLKDIEIYNSLGQLVAHKIGLTDNFYVGNLLPGIYFIKTDLGIMRFIVERP